MTTFPGKNSFEKAVTCLGRLQHFIDRIDACNDDGEAHLNWENFLNYWVKSRKFFKVTCDIANLSSLAKEIGESQKDHVLEYIFQARNADEHGATVVAEARLDRHKIGFVGGPTIFSGSLPKSGVISNNTYVSRDPSGNLTAKVIDEVRFLPSGRISLGELAKTNARHEKFFVVHPRDVDNRGKRYEVPRDAEGNNLSAKNIMEYGKVWLTDLHQRIEENL